jgi:hypothetical protein
VTGVAWLIIVDSSFYDLVYFTSVSQLNPIITAHTFRCSLVLQSSLLLSFRTLGSNAELSTTPELSAFLSLSLILRPTVSRPVFLGIKHPSGTYDQIFSTVRQLRVCWRGALSLTRGRVCHLQLLLVLASTVIFGFESRGTPDHILLSQIRDFPFRRLSRLAGLQWRYLTPPPHGVFAFLPFARSLIFDGRILWKTLCSRIFVSHFRCNWS